ncbi:MAG: MIP/aquaporin family protein [Bacteroidota bacterium]
MNPYLAEFFGTLLLIVLGDGVVAGVVLKRTKSENAGWLTVVVAWGLAVTLAIFAVAKFSEAHLNPAVTIGLWMNGSFKGDMVAGYILAQLGGAFAGAIVVWLHYLPHWKETPDAAAKLSVFATGPALRSPVANLLSEIIATAVLILGVLFLGANQYSEGLKPIVVGLLIISIGLSLGGTTGFAINPARDLGPRIAHFILPIHGKGKSDWGYAWVPVVGPTVGAIIGAVVYKVLFA